MRNSKKKSPAKSKKKSKKNPLKKYQTAGAGPVVTPTPALGSSSFSPTGSFGTGTLGTSGFSTGNNTYGFNTGSVTGGAPSSSGYLSGNYTPGSTTFNNLYGGYDSGLDTTLNTRTREDFSEDTNFGQRKGSDASTLDALKPKPKQMTKGEIATTALGAVPGTVGAIANLASSSKIDDPSNYYDKKTRAELERYNKKIKASSAASSVGAGLLSTSAAWGPLAWIPAAAGAITMAASEGAKASYQAKQGNLGKSYDERVADRMAYKQRQADKKQQNLDRYSNMNYYGAGSGLAKYGGMREYQAGGLNQEVPLEEEMNIMDPAMDILMNGGIRKYMGGGYQKVTGPSHENGGVPMDLSGDGVIDSELEGGEIIEEMPIMPTMKKGGMKPKKYIWSDHLQTGGMSFAQKFEEMEKEGVAPEEIEKLRVEQEIAAKRDPSKLYAKYGGMMKYKGGGLWANIHAKRKRIAGGSGEKMRKPGSEGAPTAKALRESKRDGGLMEYQTGGQRVSRTDTGKFLAEYGAPLASVAGAAGDIGMTMSQKYTPVDPISARDVQAEKVFIDRAKDKRVGARESELIGAKRANRAVIGTGATQRENALRMTSLRAQEEAAQNVYDQNRQASATEQQLNQQAKLQADMANQRKDLTTSESRRAESLRKQSFENMRKKYMGSVMGELGNELASGLYKKEYINATLPEGVNQYALKPNAIPNKMKEINPATGKKYTRTEAINAVLIQYNIENP